MCEHNRKKVFKHAEMDAEWKGGKTFELPQKILKGVVENKKKLSTIFYRNIRFPRNK